MECELFNDLVDTCAPGDTVVVSGEVRVVSTDDGRRGRAAADRTMFLLYIHANAVLNTRKKLQGDASGAGAGDDGSGLYIHTRRDLYAISHIQVCSAHFPMLALPPPRHTHTHTHIL